MFRIYGSVEALEGEERVQRNRRFRVETSQDSEVTGILVDAVVVQGGQIKSHLSIYL